jgi:hypothetical protein
VIFPVAGLPVGGIYLYVSHTPGEATTAAPRRPGVAAPRHRPSLLRAALHPDLPTRERLAPELTFAPQLHCGTDPKPPGNGF